MQLEKSLNKTLASFLAVVLVFVFSIIYLISTKHTYAEGEGEAWTVADGYFVNFYDAGKTLTVKTTAKTVGEAIERVGIQLDVTDIIEPALDEKIDSNNFFINIYRARPVVVKDGVTEKYIMTASHDVRTIAKNAGYVIYDGDEVNLAKNKVF